MNVIFALVITSAVRYATIILSNIRDKITTFSPSPLH